MSSCEWVVATLPRRHGRHCPGDVGLTARATTQECTQIGQNGPSEPFWGICVHCCAVGLGCEWPWDRNSVHKSVKMASRRRFGAFVYTVATRGLCERRWGRNSVHKWRDRASRRLIGAFVYTVALRGSCERRWGRRSVHRSAKTASPRRFGAFVYTVATRVAPRVAIRIAT